MGPLALVEIGDGVEPQPVDPHLHPEVEGVQKRFVDPRVVEVQVRLVREEAVPVVGLSDRVPGPVRGLEVLEDDARIGVLAGIVAPHVEVPVAAPRRRRPRALEPGVLVRGVVDDQLGDHLEVPPVSLPEEDLEVLEIAVGGVDARVVGDVVAVVAPGGGVEGQDPDRRHPQLLEVVELGGQPLEVPHAVAVASRRKRGRAPRRGQRPCTRADRRSPLRSSPAVHPARPPCSLPPPRRFADRLPLEGAPVYQIEAGVAKSGGGFSYRGGSGVPSCLADQRGGPDGPPRSLVCPA